MTEKMIHGHNSAAPQLHFSSSPSSSMFFSQLSGCWIFSSSHAWLFIEKSHLVQGKLAQASCLFRAEGISSPRRVACLELKFSLSPGELDASLGEFRVRNLHEKIILPFLLALFLDLTNNHQNLQNHG